MITDIKKTALYPAILLLSFSMLLFEITLMRIYSVMFSYHFVYFVLSLAVFGIGLGGIFLKKWNGFLPKNSYSTNAAMVSILIGLTTMAIIKLPLYKWSIFGEFIVWIYVALSVILFFFFGLSMSALFHTFPARSSILYGFDLAGATLAALSIVPLLNRLNPVDVSLLSGGIAAVSALMMAYSENRIRWPLLTPLPVILLIFGGLQLSPNLTKVPVSSDITKDMYRVMSNPFDRMELVESRWSAFGRTDIMKSKIRKDEMTLFVDGAAGSVMYNFNALKTDSSKIFHLIYHFGEYFPFFFLEESEKDNAFIIGPGGGRDVVVALLGCVNNILAAEVNPDVVQIVKDYEDFNGGIYSRFSNIQIIVKDARNYLRYSEQKFDLIMTAIPITKSSRDASGYSLTENYLFTVESLKEYLDHLTPEGRIVIVAHDDAEIYRLLILALNAFGQNGIDTQGAMKHIYTIASGMMPTIIIKKEPFTKEEAQQRHQLMHKLGYTKGNFFVPYLKQVVIKPRDQLGVDYTWRMFDQILVDLSKGNITPEQLIKSASLDIGPVWDDSPFFYKSKLGLPDPFGLLLVIIIVALVFLIIILFVKRTPSIYSNNLLNTVAKYPVLKQFVLIFFSTGSGFMLVEIVLLQRLNLYIGQPLLAISLLLFSLLLGTGIGSILSSFVKRNLSAGIAIVSISIVIVLLAYHWRIESIFTFQADRRILAFIVLFPLGMLLGVPFPLTIRLMKKMNVEKYVHYMWGINGVAAVIGSIAAMILGILWGFRFAIFLAAIFYFLVFILAINLKAEKYTIGNSTVYKTFKTSKEGYDEQKIYSKGSRLR